MYEAKPIDILPGIFKEASEYASQGRFVDGDNVRFWKGFPERIGGNQSVSTPKLFNPARAINSWRSLSTAQYIGFGHARGVQLLQGGSLYNITPRGTNGYQTLTVTVGAVAGGPFQTGETVTTVAGATGQLTAAAAASPLRVSGDNGTEIVNLSGITGTFVDGERLTYSGGGTATCFTGGSGTPIYTINETGTRTGTVTGTTSGATATVTSTATLWTGTVTGGTSGATATISAVVETGKVDGGATTAWGDGTYGSSVWGGSESIYSSVVDPTTWTLANWGEDLLACPKGGVIYISDISAFEAALPTVTRMSVMSNNAPANALGIFMNEANRTLVAYGANTGSITSPGTNDLVNIRWCDEEDYTVWTASSSNTAGDLRCENGSLIVGVMSARGGKLVSTDSAIYLFRYVGLPFVFSLQQIAEGSSLIGPNASVEVDGITYWMGKDGFYFYDGSVQPLPCDVHGYVFRRFNAVQGAKVFCGPLRAYNEVWWFYVSADSTEIDSFVAFNTVEKFWFTGSKSRTAWLDSNLTISYPVGAEADGTINAEEYGDDDNGDPLAYSLQTNDFEVDDGSVFLHSRMLIPDYDRITSTHGTHTVTIQTLGWPAKAPRTKGPFTVTSATEKISVRARGRMMRFLFQGVDDFRMGRWRFRVTGHGRKE